MSSLDDADQLRRLQLLYREQVARSREAEAAGAMESSAALRDALRAEIKSRLDDRLARILALAARAHSMPYEQVMAGYAELFDATGSSPEEIRKGIANWVMRALPDPEMQQRVLSRLGPSAEDPASE
jgi:hypothetical protein